MQQQCECVVPGCPSKRGHRFPRNPEQMQKWIDVLGLGDPLNPIDLKRDSFVCQKHFTASDYENVPNGSVAASSYRNLKPSAVPSAQLRGLNTPSCLPVSVRKPATNGTDNNVDDVTLNAPTNSTCEKCKHRVVRCVQCYVCKLYYHRKCVDRTSAIKLGHGFVRCCDGTLLNPGEYAKDNAEKCLAARDQLASIFVANQLNGTLAMEASAEESEVKLECFGSDEETYTITTAKRKNSFTVLRPDQDPLTSKSFSKQYCSVPQSENYSGKNVSVHHFPKDDVFRKNSFTLLRPDHDPLASKSVSKQYCSVPQCKNYSKKNVSLHHFPKDKVLRKKWQIAVKIARPITKHTLVCGEHFLPDDFSPGTMTRNSQRKRLRNGVIPSQKIPVVGYQPPVVFGKERRCRKSVMEEEKFAIPVEELIIKQELDESTNHSLDAITEDDLSSLLQIKDEPMEEYEQPVAVSPPLRSPVDDPLPVGPKTYPAMKKSLTDFTEEDMTSPRWAVKFYLLAKDLLKDNQLLCERNEKLADEVKLLKKDIYMRDRFTVCSVCKGSQSKDSERPVVVEGATQDSGNTTQDGNTTQEHSTQNSSSKRLKMSIGHDNLQQRTPPPNTREAENATSSVGLPEKSRGRYENIYYRFMDWRLKNNVTSFSESVMLTYFQSLATTMKPTSLWPVYSMLRLTLDIRHKLNIAEYSKLVAFLKRKSDGFKSKHSKTLTSQQIHQFLREAPDDEHLFTKVAVIIGICGACKKHELRNIRFRDVEDTGTSFKIKISDTVVTVPQRSFVVPSAFYATVKKYVDLRPPGDETKTLPFFLNYINKKCTLQGIGVNKFGSVPSKIAEFLGLPDPKSYTGHCFRRSSTRFLADTVANPPALQRHGGWQSAAVAESHVDNSVHT